MLISAEQARLSFPQPPNGVKAPYQGFPGCLTQPNTPIGSGAARIFHYEAAVPTARFAGHRPLIVTPPVAAA